jgi:hydroxymethylpyrimidine pyrophosphatase-like HAD family hydrolase
VQCRLIALDLDGTLLDSRKQISPRTREALNAARERGVVTVVATGRTPHAARHFSEQIGGGPVICCNGASVLDGDGAALWEKGVARPHLERLLAICEAHRLLVECYTPKGLMLDRPLALARVCWGWATPDRSVWGATRFLWRFWRLNRVHPVWGLSRWARRADRPPVLKCMIMGSPTVLGAAAEQIHREMPGMEVSTSGPDNLEVTAPGVTKGSGLELLCARLKIPREATMAFGDSANDLAMLRFAGTGVAMGNAPDAIKAAAVKVTETCDEEGVAHMIEELCLR